jgi:hypothetical protein
MNTTRATNVFRSLGVVIGLAGIANLSVAMPFDPKFGNLGVILSCLFALLGVYLLYVAYLCWRRLSLRVVRHVCIVGAFYLLGGVGLVLGRLELVAPQTVIAVLTLVALPGVVWAYLRATRFVTRLVFGEGAAQSGSQ